MKLDAGAVRYVARLSVVELCCVLQGVATAAATVALRDVLGAAEAQEVAQWEAGAGAMLRRLDVVLLTLQGVAVERDPAKRLEVLLTSGTGPDRVSSKAHGPARISTIEFKQKKKNMNGTVGRGRLQ